MYPRNGLDAADSALGQAYSLDDFRESHSVCLCSSPEVGSSSM